MKFVKQCDGGIETAHLSYNRRTKKFHFVVFGADKKIVKRGKRSTYKSARDGIGYGWDKKGAV